MFTFLVIEKVIYNERPFFSPIKFVDVFKMYNLCWWGFLIIEKNCKQSVYSTALICVDLVYISWSLKCCFWEILNNRNACAIILNVRSSEQKVRFHLVKIYIEDFDNIYYYHSTLISRKTGWKSIQELSLLFWNSSVSLKLFQNKRFFKHYTRKRLRKLLLQRQTQYFSIVPIKSASLQLWNGELFLQLNSR